MIIRLLKIAVAVAVMAMTAVAPATGADWQAERRCLTKCPPFPRYSGIETDAQYERRMRLQAAHDRCKLDCARLTTAPVAPSFVPVSPDVQAYYRRNGMKIGQ